MSLFGVMLWSFFGGIGINFIRLMEIINNPKKSILFKEISLGYWIQFFLYAYNRKYFSCSV
jgi:hypothetical protein